MKKIFYILILLLAPIVVLADTPEDKLVNALKNKRYAKIKSLILAGADMDKIVATGVWNSSNGTSTPIPISVWNYIKDDKTRKVIKEAFLAKKLPQDTLDKKFEEFFKDAARDGNCYFDKLNTLIYAGANVAHVFTPENVNALQFSLTNKYWGEGKMCSPQFIDGMLNAGVPVNLQDSIGKTALMYEVESLDYESGWTSRTIADRLKTLLKHGADVHLKDHSRTTVLSMARVLALGGNAAMPYTLVEAGAKRNLLEEWWYTLYIYHDDSEQCYLVLKQLINEGVDVNAVAEYDMFMHSPNAYIEGNGQTAFMFLTRSLNVDVVSKLIEAGVPVDITDCSGRNAFHYLAMSTISSNGENTRKRQYNCVRLYDILKKHLDISTKDKAGKTAFDYAIVNNLYLAGLIYKNAPENKKNEMATVFFAAAGQKQTILDFITKCREISPQTVTPVPNTLPNELWAKGSSLPSAVAGTGYFFSEDGQYHFYDYYSGGMYRSHEAVGIYEYNSETKTITLQEPKYSREIPDIGRSLMGRTPDMRPLLEGRTPEIGKLLEIARTPDIERLPEKSIKPDKLDSLDLTGYTKSSPENMFILFSERLQVDTITIETSINEIPFSLASIKPDDFRTVINLLNQIDLEQTCQDEYDFQNTVRLSVTIKQLNMYHGNRNATIYPALNLIKYQNKKYKIDNDNPAWMQFMAMLTNYLSE